MAKSRFEYVRKYELPDQILPNTFLVVRVDGRGFHKFADAHGFDKPNDIPALELMNRAARAVMDDIPDVVLAFGESDEYSFLIRRSSALFSRRRSKINSTVCSVFTSAYVFYWQTYLPDRPLKYPPTFDSRVVVYPTENEVRDYFAWRQADTHINNLYNTCFWALMKSGLNATETNKALQGTDSKDKNELLYSRFGVNYNNLPQMFRKGSILVRRDPSLDRSPSDVGGSRQIGEGSSATPRRSESRHEAGTIEDTSHQSSENAVLEASLEDSRSGAASLPGSQGKAKKGKKLQPYEGLTGEVEVLHEDIIGDQFWRDRPWLAM